MKTCKGCKHADWDKTVAGKLHPSGDGLCTKVVRIPVLSQAYNWVYDTVYTGGEINRRVQLKDHCAYFAKEE